MSPTLRVTWVTLAVCAFPIIGRAAYAQSCPIERIVGQVREVEGDDHAIHVLRGGQSLRVTPGMCLVYGDRLEAGMQATVTIDTGNGPRHIGGDFDPVWGAPEAERDSSADASAALATLFQGLLSPTRHPSVYATSRGGENCPQSEGTPSQLSPLSFLRPTDQKIGTDLRAIAAAWTGGTGLYPVRARLLGGNGALVSEDHACTAAHVVLPVPPATLHDGDRLVLEIEDSSNTTIRYNLAVVDPKVFVRPPFATQQDWVAAAWRVAKGSRETRLDAISRLLSAPSEALGAQWILGAVWSSQQF